jgi:hypothetical protein
LRETQCRKIELVNGQACQALLLWLGLVEAKLLGANESNLLSCCCPKVPGLVVVARNPLLILVLLEGGAKDEGPEWVEFGDARDVCSGR